MRLSIAVLAIGAAVAFTVADASAQMAGNPGMGGRHKRGEQQSTAKTTAPKADEKAYEAALKSVPNKKYDPWQGAR